MTNQSMTATAPFASSDAAQGTNFAATVGSEWLKLTALRSTYVTLALGVLLSIATTALTSVAIGSTQAVGPGDLQNPIIASMIGNVFALIVFSVFGVMAVTREYSSGMMRLTLTATPKRSQVFFAKLGLVSLITLVFGLLTTLGMFLVAQAIFGAYGMPVASLSDQNARITVLGLGAVMPFFPIVGLALGFILRSTAGAITSVLGFLWLPVIFGELLPMWWREHLVSLLPGNALDSLTLANIIEKPSYSEPLVGAFIASLWLAAVVGAGYLALVRRDA